MLTIKGSWVGKYSTKATYETDAPVEVAQELLAGLQAAVTATPKPPIQVDITAEIDGTQLFTASTQMTIAEASAQQGAILDAFKNFSAAHNS